MRVVLGAGCDKAWRDSLDQGTACNLARYFKNEDDGAGPFFRQKGVRTRVRFSKRYNSRNARGHERIVILREDYGFRAVGIHRQHGFAFDEVTLDFVEQPETWVETWTDYCWGGVRASFPPAAPTQPNEALELRR